MSRKLQQEKQQPTNHIYWASMRFSVYTGISFLIGLSCILKVAQIGVFIIIACFLVYMLSETFRDYVAVEIKRHDKNWKRLLRQAIAPNIHEFGFLTIALLVGLIIGIGW